VTATSAVLNGALLGGFFALFVFIDRATAQDARAPMEARENNEVEDAPVERDLTYTEVGLDSTKDLGYNVDRIEDVPVPGTVDMTQSIGIVGGPEVAIQSVPPPPGSGGGLGGAPLDPSISGTGNMYGTIGGMGGLTAGGFGGRSGATRKKMREEGGGSTESEAAVGRGLRFLAHHQCPDGSWSLNNFGRFYRTKPLGHSGGTIKPYNADAGTSRDNRTAGTAFGLLPFLAAGITNKPGKDIEHRVDYSRTVGAAVRYLISVQVKSGAQRGYYGGDEYSHGLATIAMCEAYALTSDPGIKSSAQLAVNYIVAAQHDGGGWRYAPRTPGDTSVTGWMLMALKSGQMAGLTVAKSALKKVESYLNDCESKDGSIKGSGGYGYVPGSGPSEAMTAVGGLCRQYLGVNPRNPSLLQTVERLKAVGPQSTNVYFLYYATQVMHHMGGDAWSFWNLGKDGKSGIRETLISRQEKGVGNPKPQQEGSFKGDEHVGGRLGATSLCLLSLEVYYRHLPLYRRDAGMKDK
jgi:hypothetical protein